MFGKFPKCTFTFFASTSIHYRILTPFWGAVPCYDRLDYAFLLMSSYATTLMTYEFSSHPSSGELAFKEFLTDVEDIQLSISISLAVCGCGHGHYNRTTRTEAA